MYLFLYIYFTTLIHIYPHIYAACLVLKVSCWSTTDHIIWPLSMFRRPVGQALEPWFRWTGRRAFSVNSKLAQRRKEFEEKAYPRPRFVVCRFGCLVFFCCCCCGCVCGFVWSWIIGCGGCVWSLKGGMKGGWVVHLSIGGEGSVKQL